MFENVKKNFFKCVNDTYAMDSKVTRAGFVIWYFAKFVKPASFTGHLTQKKHIKMIYFAYSLSLCANSYWLLFSELFYWLTLSSLGKRLCDQ